MFDSGIAIALELIALGVGALVIIACHNREDSRLNVFPRFVGYFSVIIAFIALLGSVIAFFNHWMNAGGTVKGSNSHAPAMMLPPAPLPVPAALPSSPTPSTPSEPTYHDGPRNPAQDNK